MDRESSERLPLDCVAEYAASFLAREEADALYDWIVRESGVPEMRQVQLVDGTVLEMDTGKIMFVDPELEDTELLPVWNGGRMACPRILEPVRDRLERRFEQEFGVCVCLYYPDGRSGVDFHYDPPAFGSTALVPSLSLGEKREFLIRSQSDHSDVYRVELDHGSLLVMGEGFQDRYEHSLPTNEIYTNPRVNLTFRPFDWPPDYERSARV